MIASATEASGVYLRKHFAYLVAIDSIVIHSSSKLLMNVAVKELLNEQNRLKTNFQP